MIVVCKTGTGNTETGNKFVTFEGQLNFQFSAGVPSV